MKTRPSVALAFTFASTGCGGAPPPTPAPPPPPVAAASSASSIPAPPPPPAGPSRRSPPEAILRYWPFDASAGVVFYGDAGGFLHTELGPVAMAAALAVAHEALTPDIERCIHDAAQAVRDVAVGDGFARPGPKTPYGDLTVARFDESAFPVSKCVAAAGGKPITIEGAGEAFDFGRAVLVHQPGLLLFGGRNIVTTALRSRSGPVPFPAAVSLGPDEYAAWRLFGKEGVNVVGTTEASSERLRIHMEGEVPPSLAEELPREWQGAKGQLGQLALSPDEATQVSKLVDAVDVHHDGGHLVVSVDLHEPVADQARDLGTTAALMRAAVKQYVANAKAAEARNAVGQIAKDLAAYHERESMEGVILKPGKTAALTRPKLVSLPPVPKVIPKGVKYQSTPDDWKAWDVIKFEMDGPQYYQYEVRAAKDGLSADIFARGDLDGNGKTSEFRLHVRIAPDPNNPRDKLAGPVVIDDHIVERDPRE